MTGLIFFEEQFPRFSFSKRGFSRGSGYYRNGFRASATTEDTGLKAMIPCAGCVNTGNAMSLRPAPFTRK